LNNDNGNNNSLKKYKKVLNFEDQLLKFDEDVEEKNQE